MASPLSVNASVHAAKPRIKANFASDSVSLPGVVQIGERKMDEDVPLTMPNIGP